jgi:hypothetical protein
MAYQTRLNANGIDRRASFDLILEFNTLRAELDDLRTKYGALQAALNAGAAPGAGTYPNGTMALAAKQFLPT